jgi:YYY domain-containing protein
VAEAISWYLGLLLIGGGGLLPATLLFSRLNSGGVLYARPLALLLIAQAVWLTAALTPIPYGTGLVVIAIAVLYLWSAWLGWQKPERLRLISKRYVTWLVGEALFIGVFLVVILVRVQVPAAVATEKPMDFGLLMAVHETESFPPLDPWLAGFEVSYYHLGHVMVDITGRVVGLNPGIGFNLGLAAVGALAAVAMAGLASDMVSIGRPRQRVTFWIAGVMGVVGLIWLAPFEGLVELAAANGIGSGSAWGHLGVQGLPGPTEATSGVPDQFWWWWRATRIVPGTISEFPAFSLILGDLHAHLLALPLGIVALALALDTFVGKGILTWRRWLTQPQALLLAGMLFAGLAMTNAWDVLAYGSIWFAASVISFSSSGSSLRGALWGSASYLVAPTFLGLVIACPLLLTLDGSSIGAAPVTGGASDPMRFLLFWGPLMLPVGLTLMFALPPAKQSKLSRGLLLAVIPVAIWAVWLVAKGDTPALVERGNGWLTLLMLVGAIGIGGAMVVRDHRQGERGRAAWLALAVSAGAIILVAELIHVTDALGIGRMNSVFKFWYVAWPMLAAAGAVGLALSFDHAMSSISTRLRTSFTPGALPRTIFAGVMVLLWLGSLLYAPAAVVSRAREGQEQGLEAFAYLERSDPSAATALRWVREELDSNRHVMLEAVSPSYGGGNVLSAASGVPTLLGWPGHELQWHSDAPFAVLQQIVDTIYSTGSTPGTLALAHEYGITHVY